MKELNPSQTSRFHKRFRFAGLWESRESNSLTIGISARKVPGRVTLSGALTSTFLVKTGDVLFNRTSETQEELVLASVYQDKEPIVFGGFVIRGRQRAAKFHPKYLGYAFRAPFVRSQIISAGQGVVRANISQQSLSKVLVPLPPIREQIAIAEALFDADALIVSLEALIVKKRAIKRSAMQGLLSGRKRLPGFSGEWKPTPLASVADIRSGGTPSTLNPKFWNGDVPWCTPTDITALNGGKYLRETIRNISEEGLKTSSAEIIPPHSVVMTSRATIGECAINTKPVTTNQGFKNFVPYEETDAEFLYYLMSIQKERLVSLCGGSTFLEIGKTHLSCFEILFPPKKAEQRAISEVLADLDNEVDSLSFRLRKARQIKQGMMQELLTGRVRLK